LYSPVKVCFMRSLIAMQNTGLAAEAMPTMNSGGSPEGGGVALGRLGYVMALYAR
jgi:hypothetical protein